MATYPIFSQEGGQRIAINPNSVTSIVEIEPKRVLVCLPDGGSANIAMSLEDGFCSPRRHTRVGCGRDLMPNHRRLKADTLDSTSAASPGNEIALVQKALGFVLF